MPGGSPVNTDESELALFRAERRVREIQAKLHRWADHDPQRDLWSARCPETGTAGAGGGSGKPTGACQDVCVSESVSGVDFLRC